MLNSLVGKHIVAALQQPNNGQTYSKRQGSTQSRAMLYERKQRDNYFTDSI